MATAAPEIKVELNHHRFGGEVPIGYRPHLRVGKGEYLGIEVLRASEGATKGSAEVVVRLLYWPQVNYDALAAGASFDVLEGPNIVGHGRVIDARPAI